MSKNFNKYLGLLMAIFLTSCSEPPVNWNPTFDSADTIPYGTYVLRKELPNIFPDSEIENIKTETETIDWESHQNDTYFYIDSENRLTETAWQNLLYHVNQGGTAFISIGTKVKEIEKELGIQINNAINYPTSLPLQIKNQEFKMEKGFRAAYFSEYNSENTDILGSNTIDGIKNPNFIRVYYGKGNLLLHTEPYIFTNYYLLRSNYYQYVEKALSEVENKNILWDNHRIFYRSGQANDGGFFDALSFILKNDGLKQALYLLIILGFLYLLFNSKRRQRAVPILLAYPNYSMNFAKTLSNLYRNNSNHTAMVRYKINYFLEQIRSNYHITSKETEKDFSEILSIKSGVDLEICRKLVLTIDLFKSRPYLDKADFLKLQSQIEIFNQKSIHNGRNKPRQ